MSLPVGYRASLPVVGTHASYIRVAGIYNKAVCVVADGSIIKCVVLYFIFNKKTQKKKIKHYKSTTLSQSIILFGFLCHGMRERYLEGLVSANLIQYHIYGVSELWAEELYWLSSQIIWGVLNTVFMVGECAFYAHCGGES